MRTNLLFSVLLLACASGSAWSQTVSESEAYQRAAAFYNSQSRHAKGQGEEELSLQLSYTSANGPETYYYVFNNESTNSFVVVSGNELAPAEILGYNDEGLFDYEQAPDNFKWWLSQYDASIHAAIQQGQNTPQSAPRRAKKFTTSIIPMIETKWNQDKPFNNSIPNGNGRYVTGCVATATAQVMYYHKCPVSNGTGSHSYTYNGYTYSADFNTTYDWANMKLDYNSSYTTAQGNAVAKLMYHVGVSVNMKYGYSSGASTYDVAHSLPTYFGYDKSAEFVYRSGYTDDEWVDLVYGELSAGRPLVYSGSDIYGGGGHAFICHGYQASDNTYRFNWGWGGYCDGWFTMMGDYGLQPEGSGIGGAGEGSSYTSLQGVIINLQPDKGTAEYALGITIFDDIYFEGYDNPVTFTDQFGVQNNDAIVNLATDAANARLRYGFTEWNNSGDYRTYTVSLMLENQETGAVSYVADNYTWEDLQPNGLAPDYYYITMSDLPGVGKYNVYPVIRRNASSPWQRLRVPLRYGIPTITVINDSDAKRNITFNIDKTSLRVGRQAQITNSTTNSALRYTGTFTYTSSNPSVASVDANGVVTGVSVGTATISVSTPGDDNYNDASASFTVSVVTAPFILEDYSMTNQGYFTPSTVAIWASILNNSGFNYSTYPFSLVVETDWFRGTNNITASYWYDGETIDGLFDFSDWSAYFDPGETGTFSFYDFDGELIGDPIPFRICSPLDITYTMSSAEWGTICLPFEAEVPTGLTAYSVVGVDGDELQLEAVDFMEMNTPYLLNGTAGSYTFDGPDTTPYFNSPFADGLLRGNTKASTDASPVYAPADSYVLQNKNGVLGFYKVKESQKIKQYSAYIVLDEATATAAQYSALRIGSRPEAIGEIASEEMQEGNAYSLQGHRIDGQNHKGLVISNGKVSFIK